MIMAHESQRNAIRSEVNVQRIQSDMINSQRKIAQAREFARKKYKRKIAQQCEKLQREETATNKSITHRHSDGRHSIKKQTTATITHNLMK